MPYPTFARYYTGVVTVQYIAYGQQHIFYIYIVRLSNDIFEWFFYCWLST